jgi:glycosyltransferase involved in cell wall biosynthesis
MKPEDIVCEVRKDKNLLTIITPVFNGQDYIAETIESVLSLSKEFSFEYIVIDDGSTDATAEIIAKYSKELRSFHQENMGEAAAVNLGVDMAIGDYCIIVNHDDPLLTVELFETSVKLMESDRNLVATYPDWILIDALGEKIEVRETREYSITELAAFSNCLPGPGACFRKVEALAIGGRNANYKYVSDYDFWLRLSQFGHFKRISKPLAQWRLHNDSTSIKNVSMAMAFERIEVIKDYLSYSKTTKRFSRIALSHAYYYAARLTLASNGLPGRKFLLKSIWVRKRWPERANLLVTVVIFFAPVSIYFYRKVESFLPNRYRIAE